MGERNWTQITEFIFMGLTDRLDLQVPIFMVFLLIFVITMVGNLGMIVLIGVSPQLHTPMYFFLSNLSFLDICYSLSITPRLLLDLLAEKKVISYAACFTQFYFYAVFATTECYLLAVMAYDRYMAICNPLLYTVVMYPRVCALLVAGSYIAGTLNSLVHMSIAFQLDFCGSNVINNFYCDGPPLYALACSDTHVNNIVMFVIVGFNMIMTNLTILISYAYILDAILKIHSTEGRHKAFSTCASHLMAVIIFYGAAASMYSRPSSRHSQNLDKVASVFYTVVTPMLNPLIYSLRNKEVKDTLRKILKRKVYFSCFENVPLHLSKR